MILAIYTTMMELMAATIIMLLVTLIVLITLSLSRMIAKKVKRIFHPIAKRSKKTPWAGEEEQI
jgi:hypothetical protein